MILFAVSSKRICKKVKLFCQFMSIYSSSSAVQSIDMVETNRTYCPDYDELRKKMQNLANSGNVDLSLQVFHFMKTVPGKPTIYDYNSLLNCYLKSKNVCLHDLSVLQLEIVRLGLYPNALTFNTILKGLNLLGESKVALSVIREMCDYSFAPSFSCLSCLLKKCLDFMELVDALSVLELMLVLNYIPTEPKVILLINSLSRRGMTSDACFVFFKLLEKGHLQSPYFYNPILWSLCKSDQISNALAFFCSLTKKGLVHNACSYTALVYGFGKKGLFKEAFRCLKIREADSGCYPNIKTYTTIIKCLCDYGRTKDALVLFGKMEKWGCNPDIVTYNIIIRALSHENMVLEIEELYQTLYEKGISPDRYTATALAGLLKRGSIGFARSLLRNIISSEIEVDVAVYNVYFYCMCYAREPEDISSMVRSMRIDGIEPNNITFNTILKGFCEKNALDKALNFFERAMWPEKRPDLVSFNTLLSAACKMGDTFMVKRVIDLMVKEGIKFNVVGLTCLMQYYCNVGYLNECLKVFRYMVSHGPRPSTVTVNTLIVNLCKNRKLEAAYGIFGNLNSYGLSPDARTYTILIWAAKNERNYPLVEELRRKWIAERRRMN